MCTLHVGTSPAHWVTSFMTSMPVCVYSCSQLKELWFNAYTCTLSDDPWTSSFSPIEGSAALILEPTCTYVLYVQYIIYVLAFRSMKNSSENVLLTGAPHEFKFQIRFLMCT